MQTIIIKPVVTEKSMQGGGPAKYTFMVASSATKTDIKLAVKQSFNVNVVSVTTTNIKGKRTKIGKRRTEVKSATTKKAVIMLRKGEKISFAETGIEVDKKKKK